ncbi:hypothetical protein AAC691_21135 [Nguyenibacter vanlangensis]|uniref:Uncharacterized protein n=2 Tax=Nguyenibacter vanlangensis TaxID=1216886 RepID=A0ABZ3D527_9PROT
MAPLVRSLRCGVHRGGLAQGGLDGAAGRAHLPEMSAPIDETEFRRSLVADAPPADWPAHLRALWHDARGEWQAAHDLVNEGGSPAECRVHAYLHRREGDLANADYWYWRARVPADRGPLDVERDLLLRRFLAAGA